MEALRNDHLFTLEDTPAATTPGGISPAVFWTCVFVLAATWLFFQVKGQAKNVQGDENITVEEKRRRRERMALAASARHRPAHTDEPTGGDRQSHQETELRSPTKARRIVEGVKADRSRRQEVVPNVVANNNSPGGDSSRNRLHNPVTDETYSRQSPSGADVRLPENLHAVDMHNAVSSTVEGSCDNIKEKVSKKSKKRMPMLEPPQAFVEAIAKVTLCHVQMGAHYRSEKNPTLSKASSATLRLDNLIDQCNSGRNGSQTDATRNERWTVLTTGLANVLQQGGRNARNPFVSRLKTVQEASQWHSRAESILFDVKGNLSRSREGNNDNAQHILIIMESLQAFVTDRVREWIDNELPEDMLSRHDQNESRESDLFADDYGQYGSAGHNPAAAPTQHEESRHLVQLCCLLEESSLPSTKFLAQVINGDEDMARRLWHIFMSRLDGWIPTNLLSRRISAASQAFQLSADFRQVVAKSILLHAQQCEINDRSGKEWEQDLSIRPLIKMAAYTAPEVGDETVVANGRGTPRTRNIFLEQLDDLPNYPLCLFSPDASKQVGRVLDQSKHTMNLAARASETMLRQVIRLIGKQDVFRWLASLYQVNEALATMLKADLLSREGFWGVASSRGFGLGLMSTVLSLCGQSLQERLKTMGPAAFDTQYLNSEGKDGRLKISSTDRKLISCPPSQTQSYPKATVFSGSTEFFFLCSGLLRIFLHPSLRTLGELEHQYNQILNQLHHAAAAKETTKVANNLYSMGKPIVAAWIGWKTCLEEENLATNITSFCILQLEWLAALSRESKGAMLADIPDWMCRQPSHWLAHIARTMPQVLNPLQGGLIVEYAIELLHFGTTTSSDSGYHDPRFSPLVVTELIDIASAFVSAGVRRAKQRQRARGSRKRWITSDYEEDHDRSLDIYTSLDKRDLGVTVFTNPQVVAGLCPTLLQTYRSLDIVEGLDVDRDSFDKFAAKTSIADLLLRLIEHPGGEFLESVLTLESSRLAKFATSIAAAIGYLMDDSFQRLADITSLMKKRRLSQSSRIFFASQQKVATSFLRMARTQLLLLFKLSKDSRFSRLVGGHGTDCSRELSTMLMHFILMMTEEDGGTNTSLDMRLESSDRTSVLVSRLPELPRDEQVKLCNDLVSSRRHARDEYGLDVSQLCYLLFALGSCWHRSYLLHSSNEATKSSSPFLECLAANDDFDMTHLQNVHRRLICSSPGENHAGVSDQLIILERDGYSREQGFDKKYDEGASENPTTQRRRRDARKDQLSHEAIEAIADKDCIARFMADLSSTSGTNEGKKAVPGFKDFLSIEKTILRLDGEEYIKDDDYASRLQEWTVSSDSFSCGAGGRAYSHYYDEAARGKALSGGRALLKEAKRIHKTLPCPHPDGAIFVCFEEERMDLCRSIMTGPVDTPYALGVFTFDVFFPGTYPDVPPLVTFMTTGGGQTRFNPNLYQDGKVCLSLLGTWHGTDESEKWNPKVSSLGQVLLSIQTQLLVKQPYFNEPGYDRARGTPEGEGRSKSYNNNLRLSTLRHAIIGAMRSPPNGFEEVTKRHFGMCRQRILLQAKIWTLEAFNTPLYSRFLRAYGELLTLLSGESLKGNHCLPPRSIDMDTILRSNTTLKDDFDRIQKTTIDDAENDRKPAAHGPGPREPTQVDLPPVDGALSSGSPGGPTDETTSTGTTIEEGLLVHNPWDLSSAAHGVAQNETGNPKMGDDSDDELYS